MYVRNAVENCISDIGYPTLNPSELHCIMLNYIHFNFQTIYEVFDTLNLHQHWLSDIDLLQLWFIFCFPAGGELVVRPKTHTRESSRGMLTLTEEEASRRSGGSPAQSPCHSLPSGRPRRRESEPTGPQRPVRDSASQLEESSALWWHVGGQMSGGDSCCTDSFL